MPHPWVPWQRCPGDIVVHRRRERRFKCRCCRHTFTATHGTPFYRLHHALDLVTVVLALLARGCPVQAIVFAFCLHENTVHAWLLRGGTQTQQVHQHLVLRATGTGTQIHTAFIERLNSTSRCSSAHLARRSRSLADQEATLVAGMYLVGTVYNLCRVHDSLRIPQTTGRRRWHERTPAMAAALTDHCWSMHDLLWWRPPITLSPSCA